MRKTRVNSHYDKVKLQIGQYTEIELSTDEAEKLEQDLSRERSQAEAWKGEMSE